MKVRWTQHAAFRSLTLPIDDVREQSPSTPNSKPIKRKKEDLLASRKKVRTHKDSDEYVDDV